MSNGAILATAAAARVVLTARSQTPHHSQSHRSTLSEAPARAPSTGGRMHTRAGIHFRFRHYARNWPHERICAKCNVAVGHIAWPNLTNISVLIRPGFKNTAGGSRELGTHTGQTHGIILVSCTESDINESQNRTDRTTHRRTRARARAHNRAFRRTPRHHKSHDGYEPPSTS